MSSICDAPSRFFYHRRRPEQAAAAPSFLPAYSTGLAMGKVMEVVIVGAIGAASAMLVQVAGFWLNRKSGLSEAQVAYQDTLEGMNKAFQSRISELERQLAVLEDKNHLLTEKVEDLTRQVRDLTVENLELHRKMRQ